MAFTAACTLAGCGNLIGLGGYSVADDSAGKSGTGNGDVAGSDVVGGSAGHELGEGGASGTIEESSGAAGASGASESAGAADVVGGAGSSGTLGSSGTSGSGGAPASCPSGCDDANDCTSDSCVSAECVHAPLAVGSACGVARSCDAQATCVRCRDTAGGTAQDFGCSASAPICLGSGLDAACAGCTSATDCSDGNECTTETCTAGKCVFASVPAGSSCATGVCNGTAAAEKCVACADNAVGRAQDSGCSPAKPLCDTSGTATCYECLSNSDCATDNVSCTVETCTNHTCSHVPTDSQCAPSGDVCKPSKCDAVLDCKKIDISSQATLIDADSIGNGSFELGTKPATGWSEDGKYWITKDCGTSGCIPGSNTGKTIASVGKALAWLGGIVDAGVGDLRQSLALPVGAQLLHVQADTNFQTQSKTAANNDTFQVRLMDASYVQIGSPLLSKSALDAQTGTTHVWTANGVDTTVDVSAYAGKVVSISFWSSSDTTSVTDFFLDNVRVTVTVCK